MSRVLINSNVLNCDHLGCQTFFDSRYVITYLPETRAEAKAEGWAVNVPRWRGPRNLNPHLRPFRHDQQPRLDFCPEHTGDVKPP